MKKRTQRTLNFWCALKQPSPLQLFTARYQFGYLLTIKVGWGVGQFVYLIKREVKGTKGEIRPCIRPGLSLWTFEGFRQRTRHYKIHPRVRASSLPFLDLVLKYSLASLHTTSRLDINGVLILISGNRSMRELSD